MIPNFNIIGAGLLIIACGGWFLAHDMKTVQKERARVSAEASKKSEKAQAARKRVDAAPPGRVLELWYRD